MNNLKSLTRNWDWWAQTWGKTWFVIALLQFKHIGCCERGRADACLPAVPCRVGCDAGCPSIFPRQGTIKEDHVSEASVSDTSKGVFQFLRYSFLQSSRLPDKSSRVTSSIGIGVGYKVSGSQCGAQQTHMAIHNYFTFWQIGFWQMCINSHTLICMFFWFVPLIVRFKVDLRGPFFYYIFSIQIPLYEITTL